MSVLEVFNKEFIKRHDFKSSEIDYFLNTWWDKAAFKNIPEAWLIPLDNMVNNSCLKARACT